MSELPRIFPVLTASVERPSRSAALRTFQTEASDFTVPGKLETYANGERVGNRLKTNAEKGAIPHLSLISSR